MSVKKAILKDLLKKRDDLKTEIADLDTQIEATWVRSRDSSQSLRQVVADLLRSQKEGLTFAELHDQVLAAGYQTVARDFRVRLRDHLHDAVRIAHDRPTDRYTLTEPGADD